MDESIESIIAKDESIIAQRDADFKKFSEAIEREQDDAMKILRAHLLVEHYLDKIIMTELGRGDIIIDSNFSFHQKIIVIDSLDILQRRFVDFLRALNKVRNDIAHVMNYKISEQDVDRIGKPFGVEYLEVKKKNIDNAEKLLVATLWKPITYLMGFSAGRIMVKLQNKELEKSSAITGPDGKEKINKE